NRSALEQALTQLGARLQGVCTNVGPPHGQFCTANATCDSAPAAHDGVCRRTLAFPGALTSPVTCTEPVSIIVPHRPGKRGKRVLRIAAKPAPDPVSGVQQSADIDHLKLICQP